MLWESGILYLPRKPVVKTTSLWKQTPLIGASFPHIKKDLLRTSNKEYLVGCQSLQTHKNQLRVVRGEESSDMTNSLPMSDDKLYKRVIALRAVLFFSYVE